MKEVAGYIQRKSMLYETVVEYGDYTMNHVQGCAHGCIYPCYAFLQKKRFGQVKSYEDWLKPYLVENTLDLLRQEIPRLRDKIQSVLLCFTTDPFMMGYEEICRMSMDAIGILNASGIKCTVLTKGILPEALANRTRFPVDNEYGINSTLELEDYYRMKFDYAVEDSPNAFRFFEHLPELKVLVFDRPWNRKCALPNGNYQRCADWESIRKIVTGE